MSYYTGTKGQSYYDMRKSRRDDFLQARRASHFQPHIKPDDTVLDFGCGTGGVLEHIKCGRKLGIEVNAPSVQEAIEKNIEVHADFSAIEDKSVDVVISNHALEHVMNPAEHIQQMFRVLKPGGQAVLVVPAESPASLRFFKWRQDDVDQHIYSWTPLSFGNLISQCGFTVENGFKRPIGYSKFIRFLAGINESIFQIARKFAAFILQRYEVVCIAKKN